MSEREWTEEERQVFGEKRERPLRYAFHLRDAKRVYRPAPFAASGKPESGVVTITIQQPFYFRGDELFLDDGHAGRGTLIEGIFIGAKSLLSPVCSPLPTWVFSEWLPFSEREEAERAVTLVGTAHETPEIRLLAARLRLAKAAMRMDWDVCAPNMPTQFAVRFLKECRLQGVLWGEEYVF